MGAKLANSTPDDVAWREWRVLSMGWAMDELFPVGAGASLGILLARYPPWLQATSVVAVGLLATVLAGEYDPFWFHALIDCAQAALGAVVAGAIYRGGWAKRGRGNPPRAR
jgi:hypothetical protein